MQYQKLGNTDLELSRLCLGTMTMGWSSSKEDSFAVMDYAVDNGINFFDTADIYSFWAKNNDGGVAESWIGQWLTERNQKNKIIIATKVRGRMWEGPDGEGLSRAHMMRAVEDSLRRLQVEVIDLYQSHWPDEDTPLEETFRAFEDMIQQGKVRYIGCSNHTAGQLRQTLDFCRANDTPRYESLQPHYNLVHRTEYEAELMKLCEQENLGVIPYSSLAGGFLTGKYSRESVPPGSRGHGSDRLQAYMNKKGFDIIEAIRRIGQDYQATAPQIALAWLLANPTVTSAIIGANTASQLRDTLPAVEIELAEETKAELDQMPSPA